MGFQITQIITKIITAHSILLNETVLNQNTARDTLSPAVQECGWEAGGYKKRQIEQLLHATFSSVLFAFC